jgi:hypothetical protein
MLQDLLEQTPKHLIFVNSDGSPCTTRSGERQQHAGGFGGIRV